MNMVKLIGDFLGGAVLSTFHSIGGGGRKNAARKFERRSAFGLSDLHCGRSR